MLLALLEAAVAVLALWQLAGIAAMPAFRAETIWRPGWKWPLILLAAAGSAATLIAALWLPIVRHAGAGVLAALLLAAWWRARPSYGRLRRWPPGSLGFRQSLGALQQQRYYLDQAARFGPVFKSAEFFSPVVCIVGLRRARALLATRAESLAGARFTRRYRELFPGGALRYMDAATHREVAPRFRAGYGELRLDAAAPVMRGILRTGLDRLASDSAAGGAPVHGYLQRAVLGAVGFLFYGLPPGDARLGELERALALLQAPALGKRGWQEHARQGFAGVRNIIESLQTVSAGDGYLPAFRAMAGPDGRGLDDPTVVGNFALFSHIAYGDLTGLHLWLFKMLSDHPETLDRLRSGAGPPAVAGAEPDPAVRIVMETLRLEQSEFLYRRVLRNLELDGMVIPAGWMIRCCVHESHRDPDVFPDPDRFDPDRFAVRTYSREEYSPFGADAHACMGSSITHFLGGLFVEELAGFTWRVVEDGPPAMTGNRHRNHWAPSDRLRVIMTPRTSPSTGLPGSP